jgi:hypothetical protein
MMKQVVVIGMVSMALMGQAQAAGPKPIWLDIHGFSYHDNENRCDSDNKEPDCKKYKEVNPGLGLSVQVAKHLELGAGWYENSHDATTMYMHGALIYDIPLSKNWTVTPLVRAGLASGYKETEWDVGIFRPMGQLGVRLSYDRLKVELAASPGKTFADKSTDLYTLNFGFKL